MKSPAVSAEFAHGLTLTKRSLDTSINEGETLSHNRNISNPKNGTTSIGVVRKRQEDFENGS